MLETIKKLIYHNTFCFTDYFKSANTLISEIKRNQEKHHSSWDQVRKIFTDKINELNLKKGAEIGIAFGGHCTYILENTNIDILYGIDPYKHFWNYIDPMNLSTRKFNYLYTFVLGKLDKFGDRFKLIRGVSGDSLSDIEILDFIYIDGDHSNYGVKKDLENTFNKIKKGGLIGGDDYGHINFPGVKQAVDEFFKEKKLEVNINNGGVWYVIK